MITPKQILELINRLPDAESHVHICRINGKHCVTNEWFAGNFAGRSFEVCKNIINCVHMPCDKICNYCAEDFNLCESCGKSLKDE